MAQEPYQLLNGPFAVYIKDLTDASPDVELAPDIDDAPGGNWVPFGVSSDKDITEEGIMVNMPQAINWFRGQTTAKRKGFRTEEDVIVKFTLADASAENFSRGLNNNPVSLAGNQRTVDFYRGPEVAQSSLLIYGDGKSPYGPFNSFLWIPRASHSGDIAVKLFKGEPIGLTYEWHALFDDDHGYGRGRFADAAGS